MRCSECQSGSECIESCIDCDCAACVHHGMKASCCLPPIANYYEPDARPDDCG